MRCIGPPAMRALHLLLRTDLPNAHQPKYLATCGGALYCVYERFITAQRHAAVMPGEHRVKQPRRDGLTHAVRRILAGEHFRARCEVRGEHQTIVRSDRCERTACITLWTSCLMKRPQRMETRSNL